MGTRPGQDYVRLVDANGDDIPGALLPLDTDLWNGDRTRFTVLFDPGRVKRGILPNRDDGPAAAAGRDVHDRSSAATGPTRTGSRSTRDVPQGLSRRSGRRAGARRRRPGESRRRRPARAMPLRVTFPAPLDRGLLQRALTIVARRRTRSPATSRVEPGETAWRSCRASPGAPAIYVISVLPALEDPSGNRIGQAFETLDAGRRHAVAPRSRHPLHGSADVHQQLRHSLLRACGPSVAFSAQAATNYTP